MGVEEREGGGASIGGHGGGVGGVGGVGGESGVGWCGWRGAAGMHWRPLNTITTKKLQGGGGVDVWVVWVVRVVWVGVGGGAQRACIGGH